MKIDRDLTTFKPVTLTFETHAELKEFVDYIGETKGDTVIPYSEWELLNNIVYGSTEA